MLLFRVGKAGFLVLLFGSLLVYAYLTNQLPFGILKQQTSTGQPQVSGAAQVRQETGRAFQFGDVVYGVSGLERRDGPGTANTLRGPYGKFVVLSVSVQNHGNAPIQFSPSDFALVDGKGRLFSPDREATRAYAAENRREALVELVLQPGLSADGVLVFDVPPDATGLALRIQKGYLDVSLGQQ